MSEFQLIETMRRDETGGIVRWRLHMARLKRSAGRLGFAVPTDIREQLEDALPSVSETDGQPLRVRLTLDRKGRTEITHAAFTPLPDETVWHVRIAATKLDSTDTLLRHKTTRRSVYEAARREYTASEADEMLLLNEKGEPCEGTITSLFLDDGSGTLKTPPISCGLLAGVLRTELICQRRARVQRLTLDDLRSGHLYMGNSLRGLVRATLVLP